MRPSVVTLCGLLLLAVGAAPARAQDQGGFGLDLSGDTAPKPEEAAPPEKDPGAEKPAGAKKGSRSRKGSRKTPAEAPVDAPTADPLGSLNLGGALSSSSSDLLPRLVLVGLDTADKTGAAAANRFLTALTRAAKDTGQVALETGFAQARKRLAGNYSATVRCAEAACLAGTADALDADLLVTGRLAREGRVWTLRLRTYDRDRNAVAEDEVMGKGPRDAKFLGAASDTLASRVREQARPRAKLKMSVNVPQAVVSAGERTLGVGSIEVRMPPGEVKLSVEADGFSSFSKTVTLAPGETSLVVARLELLGPEPTGSASTRPAPVVRDEPREEAVTAAALAPVGVEKKGPSGPSLFKRPALYTALVGLAAVGVGAALGMQARSVGDRARDANGDGVLDVTRREFQDAEKQATLATMLMAGGGAVAGGSVLWLVLVPTRDAPPPSTASGASPGASTGVHLLAGGSF